MSGTEMDAEDRRTEQINRDIERTRVQLSQNVDELGDKVSPSQAMSRQKEAAKSRLVGMKDKVMGSASGAGTTVGDTASGAVHGIEARTEGNPLAAGVIAFGVGLLASSAFPASRVEQRLAQQGVDAAKEHGQPLMDEARSVAEDMGSQLKETAKVGADEVKSSAQDSAEHLKDQGRDSAQQVKDQHSS